MSSLTRLVTGVKGLGITINREQIAQFSRYEELLLDWNQRMNLTAIREADLIQERHFLDSLTCVLATGNLNGLSLVDVGTGAGFPGLPLKIIFPDLKLTLLDSVRKKTGFLEVVLNELELSGVQIITERAEQVGRASAYHETYDWAVARAVSRLTILAEYLLPLVRVGGHALAQKGSGAKTEVQEAEEAISILGGGPPELIPVQLPGRDEPSFLVVIEKIKATPDRFPRRVGVPAKRPL